MMFAGYNNHVAKIKLLFPIQGVLGGRDANGNTIILAPIDYLTWNERLSNAFKEIGKGNPKERSLEKQIWLLGTASELAQEKLKGNLVSTLLYNPCILKIEYYLNLAYTKYRKNDLSFQINMLHS